MDIRAQFAPPPPLLKTLSPPTRSFCCLSLLLLPRNRSRVSRSPPEILPCQQDSSSAPHALVLRYRNQLNPAHLKQAISATRGFGPRIRISTPPAAPRPSSRWQPSEASRSRPGIPAICVSSLRAESTPSARRYKATKARSASATTAEISRAGLSSRTHGSHFAS